MRVGTSCCLDVTSLHHQDHPHACGDKTWSGQRLMLPLGSSPCVWGQDKAEVSKLNEARIIPMRVGTSYVSVVDAGHC